MLSVEAATVTREPGVGDDDEAQLEVCVVVRNPDGFRF